MCYYATTDYRCGDWRWGNMKLRCPRQHRMGETCGAKLVHHESVTKSPEDCKICQEITIKQRRLQKERDNIARWSKDGSKFAASMEKAEREAQQLAETIRELHNKRPSVMLQNRQGTRQVGPDLGFSVSQGGRGVSGTTPTPYSSIPGTSYPNSQGNIVDRHSTFAPNISNANSAYQPYHEGASSYGSQSTGRHSMPHAHSYSGPH